MTEPEEPKIPPVAPPPLFVGVEAVLSYQTPGLVRKPSVVWMVLARVGYVIYGMLLPAVSFLMAQGSSPVGPEWQDGFFYSRVALLLDGRNGWPLYVVNAYAMGCLLTLVALPKVAARLVFVRVGIYGGMILSFYYGMVLGVGMFKPQGTWLGLDMALLAAGIVIGAAVPLGAFLLLRWVMNKWGTRTVWWILGGAAGFMVFCAVTGVAVGGRKAIGVVFGAPLVLLLAGGPAFSLATYAGASLEVWRRTEEADWAGLGMWGLAWTGASGAGVFLTIQKALEAYAALPTAPPSHCYVCTAAARGHARFVGAEIFVGADGAVMRVNRQMRVLKAGEIAMKAVWPRGHGAMRWVYDRAGPVLARMIARKWAADGAYVMLKPAEWVAGILLKAAGVGHAAERMYGGFRKI